MFDLSCKQTPVSLAAEAIVKHSSLFRNSPDELTCVVYRIDPCDGYYFTTAVVGVRELEPMFGPMTHDDVKDDPKRPPGPFGFRFRERIEWCQTFPVAAAKKDWQIWLSGRCDAHKSEQVEEFEERLLPPLTQLLNTAPDRRQPLFPELWYEERSARDRIRVAFAKLPPGENLMSTGDTLSSNLESWLKNLLPKNDVALGIYIHSTQGWNLMRPRGVGVLPQSVPHQAFDPERPDNDLHAFAWTGHSTKQVLATRGMSEVWRTRICRCGDDLANAIDERNFQGICLVPILDLNDHTRSLGNMLCVSSGPAQLGPAHLFILSRLGSVLSGYLTARMPFPGLPWWPNANLDRGTAHVKAEELSADCAMDKAAQWFAENLMPAGSTVHIRVMERGQSGSGVYKLSVTDAANIKEIPRVLKVGDEQTIGDELRYYSRWVHNKRVGGASRIDVARRVRRKNLGEHAWAAIVYNLVGAGDEDAQTWADWAQSRPLKELDQGLRLLQTQLLSFYGPHIGSGASASTLMLKGLPAHLRGLAPTNVPAGLDLSALTDPTIDQVANFVTAAQSKLDRKDHRSDTDTCVVHGDLHSRNIFALTSQGALTSVALIDWGSVSEGRHPLSDISKLLVDLCYHVRWGHSDHAANWEWTTATIQAWSVDLRVEDKDRDWKVALIHHVAKLLFWTSGGEAYFKPEARLQAWEDMQGLIAPGASQIAP